MVSTDLILSGLAARRSRARKTVNTVPTSIAKLPPMTSRGPLATANAGAVPSAPFQGCTVGCSATVPATGASNSPVQFLSSANPSGCTTAPTYDWDFGDGTPNSSQQNPTHPYTAAGTYTWTLTAAASSGGVMIDTVAGGLGEGAPARQAPFDTLGAIARDPLGRGIYVADATEGATFIRFINTGNAAVTLGGRSIDPGVVRAIAGGGPDFNNDNVPGGQVDVG
ncbi:MAG: PKD domain-containing protein, partial [Blastocatellia bacterium]